MNLAPRFLVIKRTTSTQRKLFQILVVNRARRIPQKIAYQLLFEIVNKFTLAGFESLQCFAPCECAS